MHTRGHILGLSDSEGLLAHRPEKEPPEFDITAMVDLVFLMNLYFLVTFLTVAMGELALPAADHATALDADTAVILSMVRSPDGKSATLYLGDGEKGEPISDVSQQEQSVQTAIEEGVAAGKKSVLIKAESKVRLADMFRISSLLAGHDLQLHVAVMERESQ